MILDRGVPILFKNCMIVRSVKEQLAGILVGTINTCDMVFNVVTCNTPSRELMGYQNIFIASSAFSLSRKRSQGNKYPGRPTICAAEDLLLGMKLRKASFRQRCCVAGELHAPCSFTTHSYKPHGVLIAVVSISGSCINVWRKASMR